MTYILYCDESSEKGIKFSDFFGGCMIDSKDQFELAKEKMYKHIRSKICEIHPQFNIGVSTAARGFENQHWNSPYEHWLFVSSEPHVNPLTGSHI